MEATAQLTAAWRTDPGLVRGHNEDFVAVYEPESAGDFTLHGNLYIVADGVGGADAGEIASQYASERTKFHFLNSDVTGAWGSRLIEAMQAANTDLRTLARERKDSRRMATTMVAAAIHENRAYIGNVGDSRAYLIRGGSLVQVTRDQSLVARLVEEGALTPEEAVNYPYKNIILYSIGSEKRPPIDLFELELQAGDRLLLCSDGLTRHVEDREIAALLFEGTPSNAAESLVRLARERGGEDNITVAVIQHGSRAEGRLAEPEMPLATIYRPRPQAAAITEPLAPVASVTRAQEPVRPVRREPRMWPLMLFLIVVMVTLIFLLWAVIQQSTII